MTLRRRARRSHGRSHRRHWWVVVAAAVLAACATKQLPNEPVPIRTLAVLPLEPAGDGGKTALPGDAADAVTAQVYRVLADQTDFRFIPDLTVVDTLTDPAVRGAGSLNERAVALGKQVGADGVIVGRVFRYQKRVGTAFGAREPASVSFELGLVSVATGATLWQGSFDQTQEPLTSNLFNWWIFWDAGPRWVSASELAGLGVDRLFGQMMTAVATES